MKNTSTVSSTNKIIALAGIFQAAQLVRQCAILGQVEENAFRTSMQSIFKIDAPTVVGVFGSIDKVQLGLLTLTHFSCKAPPYKNMATLRTVFHMIKTAKQLIRDPALFKQLQRKLPPIILQATHFSADHPLVLNALATLYQNVFLSKNLKIPVIIRTDLAQKTPVVEKIRALLLAGIRAAVLFQQVGGKHWHLFLFRKKISAMASELLKPHKNTEQPETHA